MQPKKNVAQIEGRSLFCLASSTLLLLLLLPLLLLAILAIRLAVDEALNLTERTHTHTHNGIMKISLKRLLNSFGSEQRQVPLGTDKYFISTGYKRARVSVCVCVCLCE